jgi:GTP-binding protein HflX
MTLNGDGRAQVERALLLAVDSGTALWSVEESLDELEELARTAGAEVAGRLSQKLDHPDPRSYLGRGKLLEARDLAIESGADLVIVDDELAPNAQKTVEELLGRRVVDRTLLILDIFASAQDPRGRVQVGLTRLDLLPRCGRGPSNAWSAVSAWARGHAQPW